MAAGPLSAPLESPPFMEIKFTQEQLLEISREETAAQRTANQIMSYELEIQKGRADHWRELCEFAFKCSREALFTMPGTKAGREKRDKLLAEINKKLGGAIR
jgi:hypothetical protein